MCIGELLHKGQPCLNNLLSMQIKVSYLEIYNEIGYDLLDPERNIAKIEDLRRVQAFELDDGIVYLRHLAEQPVSSEEDALNLVVTFLPKIGTCLSTDLYTLYTYDYSMQARQMHSRTSNLRQSFFHFQLSDI